MKTSVRAAMTMPSRRFRFDQAIQILRVIRSGVDSLFITGGEPFLHPDIDELLMRAKHELKFREITLITNGFLLPKHEAALSVC